MLINFKSFITVFALPVCHSQKLQTLDTINTNITHKHNEASQGSKYFTQ